MRSKSKLNCNCSALSGCAFQADFCVVVSYGMLDDGKTESRFVDAAAKSLELPEITVPAGQKFIGWAVKTVDENGKNILAVVITAGAAGFGVPSGELEPMVLQPMFEKDDTK